MNALRLSMPSWTASRIVRPSPSMTLPFCRALGTSSSSSAESPSSSSSPLDPTPSNPSSSTAKDAPSHAPFPTPRPAPVRSALLDSVEQDEKLRRRPPPSRRASKPSDTLGPAPKLWQTALSPHDATVSGLKSKSSLRNVTGAEPLSDERRWDKLPTARYPAPVTTVSARSFQVKDNDVARAYRLLNRTLMDNNIRKELKRQDRFESGSDKRVRLDSERHRRRFKVAVGAGVRLALRNK